MCSGSVKTLKESVSAGGVSYVFRLMLVLTVQVHCQLIVSLSEVGRWEWSALVLSLVVLVTSESGAVREIPISMPLCCAWSFITACFRAD